MGHRPVMWVQWVPLLVVIVGGVVWALTKLPDLGRRGLALRPAAPPAPASETFVVGGVSLPPPGSPGWTETAHTRSYGHSGGGKPVATRQEWGLKHGKVRVERLDYNPYTDGQLTWEPAASIAVDNYSLPDCDTAQGRAYREAVWAVYFTRKAAQAVPSALNAACQGDLVLVQGWPLHAPSVAMSVETAKKFIDEFGSALALAELDPEARDAAIRLGHAGAKKEE